MSARCREPLADRPGLQLCRREPAKNTTPETLRQSGSQVRGELFGRVCDFGRAVNLRQELRVIRIGKEFDLANSGGTLPARPICHIAVNRAVDQRRADGTLLNRQQFVRVEFVISQCEFGSGVNSEPGTVAVVPRRRRMDLQFRVEFQLGDAAKVFLQNGGFDLELMLVAGVLVVAATAASESKDIAASMRCGDAARIRSARARAKPGFCSSRTASTFSPSRTNGTKAALPRPRSSAGKRARSVAAVNQLLNGEFQGLILQTRF